MGKKKNNTKTSFTDNSVNNYGINNGTIGKHILKPDTTSRLNNDHANNVDMSIWKINVIKLVSESKTDEALAEILKSNPPQDIKNQVALIAGRVSQLRIEGIAGILEKEVEIRELNKIRESIIVLLSRY